MKTNWKTMLLAVITLAMATVAHAASPVGRWALNTNGYTGWLDITTMDPAGNIVGTLELTNITPSRSDPIKGFWTDSAQKLTFYRAVDGRAVDGTPPSSPPERIQIYTGYMFAASATNPPGPQKLSGYFEAFLGTGGTATRHVFGWFASK